MFIIVRTINIALYTALAFILCAAYYAVILFVLDTVMSPAESGINIIAGFLAFVCAMLTVIIPFRYNPTYRFASWSSYTRNQRLVLWFITFVILSGGVLGFLAVLSQVAMMSIYSAITPALATQQLQLTVATAILALAVTPFTLRYILHPY